MAIECKFCQSSRTKVCETRICANGVRRRRHMCHDCDRRWTTHDGTPPRPGTRASSPSSPRTNKPPLTREEVQAILIGGLVNRVTSAALSAQFGRTKSAINAILHGDYHRGICPELARRGRRRYALDAPTCPQCIHWLGERCGMEFPDPGTDGLQFAADCSAFVSRTDPNVCGC